MIRKAVVSGTFYPSGKEKLISQLKTFFIQTEEEKVLALISPHAGYIYSGSVAGAVFSRVVVPDNIILLGPNHTGMGRRFSMMMDGEWETPLGMVKIHKELAKIIKNNAVLVEEDYLAHLEEHSLEVQLPFLLYKNPNIKIVPIAIMHADYNLLKELGIALATSIEEFGEDVLIVISSDMSHYISHEEANKRDSLAIEKILSLDGLGLLEVCYQHDITMCGVYPAIVGIECAKTLGCKSAKLIKYSTSGEVNHDYRRVVGYAGIIIK